MTGICAHRTIGIDVKGRCKPRPWTSQLGRKAVIADRGGARRIWGKPARSRPAARHAKGVPELGHSLPKTPSTCSSGAGEGRKMPE
jgi:hypothetical protein